MIVTAVMKNGTFVCRLGQWQGQLGESFPGVQSLSQPSLRHSASQAWRCITSAMPVAWTKARTSSSARGKDTLDA
jgi:hypothetical protein